MLNQPLDRWRVMSNTIPAISEDSISDWVGERNLRLGRSYFEGDLLIDQQRQGKAIKGWCQGSIPQPYRLHAAFGPTGVDEAHCSCPVGGGGRCKHVGALLLAWLGRPNAFRVVEELDTALQQRSKDDLIVLIKRMLELEPRLETLLETALPEGSRESVPVNPEIYRRQISTAFRFGGDDWMASERVAREIGVVLGSGDRFLSLEDYGSAGIVYQVVAQGILEHYEIMADEDGELADVLDRCVEGLGKCLASIEDDDAVREICLQTLFDVYRFDVDLGGTGLGEVATDLLLEHATDEEKGAIVGQVRSAAQKGDSGNAGFRRRSYGRFLLDLEMARLDDDSYLEICREFGLLTELADRLLMMGRPDDAVAEASLAGDYDLLLLAEVFRKHGRTQAVEPLLAGRVETSRDNRLAEWLKERYKERGDLSKALSLARRLLERRPRLDGYLEVRELSRDLGVWRESRQGLLDSLASGGKFGLLTDIHLDEGEIELALKSVNRNGPGPLRSADQLVRVAEAASDLHPQAALDIFRQQAERLINAKGRENYRQACTYLARVRDLHRQMSEESEWTGFIASLRERHRRLPAFREELDKAGL